MDEVRSARPSTAAPGTPVTRLLNSFGIEFRAADSQNLYMESEFPAEKDGGDGFFASEAYAEFETESPTGLEAHQYFALKKKPVEVEIDIHRLPPIAKQLFEEPRQGSRKIEWDNMIS